MSFNTFQSPLEALRDVVAQVPRGGYDLDKIMSPAQCVYPPNVMQARIAKNVWRKTVADMAGMYRGEKVLVCGGGYSITDTLGRIAQARKHSKRVKIAAVNKTHDWLIQRGIVPDFGILCDPRPHVVGYMTPHPKVTYLLGVTLDDAVFDLFREHDARFRTWTPINTVGGDGVMGDKEYCSTHFPPQKGYTHVMITGGSTVGLRAVPLLSVIGFEQFELHGFDSCFAPLNSPTDTPAMYAYEKPESTQEHVDRHVVDPQTGAQFRFFANNNMTNQAREFVPIWHKSKNFYVDGKRLKQEIKVAGDGLIPWLAYRLGAHVDMDAMKKKYDHKSVFDYRYAYPQERN